MIFQTHNAKFYLWVLYCIKILILYLFLNSFNLKKNQSMRKYTINFLIFPIHPPFEFTIRLEYFILPLSLKCVTHYIVNIGANREGSLKGISIHNFKISTL